MYFAACSFYSCAEQSHKLGTVFGKTTLEEILVSELTAFCLTPVFTPHPVRLLPMLFFTISLIVVVVFPSSSSFCLCCCCCFPLLLHSLLYLPCYSSPGRQFIFFFFYFGLICRNFRCIKFSSHMIHHNPPFCLVYDVTHTLWLSYRFQN